MASTRGVTVVAVALALPLSVMSGVAVAVTTAPSTASATGSAVAVPSASEMPSDGPSAAVVPGTDNSSGEETHGTAAGDRLRDEVDIWERAIFPLRADESDAAMQVPNADWRVRSPDAGEASLNADPIAVFEEGDTVSVEFDAVRAGGSSAEFGGTDVRLVAGRLEPSGDGSTILGTEVGSLSLLDMNLGEINEDLTFTHVGDTELDADGRATVQFDPPESGQYVLLLANASDGDGLVVADGNLSVDGDATLLGVDQAAVRTGASSVAPTTIDGQSTVTPGTNLTFDASVENADGPVGHTVVVYDETTGYVNQSFVVDVREDLSEGFNASEDVVVEHSVAETNGVARFEGTVTVDGTTVTDARRVGSVSLPTFVDSVAPAQLNPDTEYVPAEGGERLDASMTAVNGSASESLTVETLDNWTTDTRYRWVHVAVDADGAMYTETDTFRLSSGGGHGTAPDDGGGTVPGGGAPPSNGRDPTPETDVAVTDAGEGAAVEIRDATAYDPVDLDLSSVLADREGVRLERVAVEFTRDTDFDMTVTQGPEPVPSVHGTDSDIGYINVSHDEDPPTDDVSLTFTVDDTVLETRGLDPGDVTLYRYTGNEWEQLDTAVRGSTDAGYRYTATSPGLSVFSVSTAEPQAAPRSALRTSDVTLDPDRIAAGNATTASATVHNTADVAGTFTVNLTVDGTVVDRQSVTLGPGDSETVTYTRQFDENGRYQIGIAGVDAGELAVYEPPRTTTATTGSGTGDEDESTGGVLLPLLLASLVVAGILYYTLRNGGRHFLSGGPGGDGSDADDSDASAALGDRGGVGSAGSPGETSAAADSGGVATDDGADGAQDELDPTDIVDEDPE
ncbi:PGF-pre-PGF domain-containing protein [Halostella sp. PRR32]|uniref:PGF-pre-PGF domain-containing protein n=1 Tax=Halostella sp. PRR32 TaxID=3098147 RepID=UPI002B1D87CD|nr:PGF-pre-PGF domain-containing protein [Halostella sp. PRR32]